MKVQNTILGVTAILGIVVSYNTFCYYNPGVDGLLFGSVMAIIGGISGLTLREAVRTIRSK